MAEGAMQPEAGQTEYRLKKWSDGLRLSLFRKDLDKWVDVDPFKYAVDGIGVLASKPLRVFQRVRFDDDKTPCLIRERTG